MIKNKTVFVKLNNSNVNHYVNRGYEIPKTSKFKNTKFGFSKGTEIEVKIEDLPGDSRAKIIHVCEDCGIEREYSYRDAVPLKLCKKCASSGKRNSMFGKMVVPIQHRIGGISVKDKLNSEERLNRKIKRTVLHSSYRKVYEVLKGKRSKSTIYKYLGCTYEEFKIYIESRFQEGMTWENWSKTGWHLDHVIPLEMLNPENQDDFKKSCHYTNFQPMWASNNCAKRSSLPEVFVLTGCFGSGKSWVASQLTNKFHIVDYDSNKKYHPTNPVDFSKPTLLMLPIKVSTFLKEFSDKIKEHLIVINEPLDVICLRIQSRGGVPNEKSLKNRVNRMKSLSKISEFSGTSLEVLNYLSSV